MNEQSLNERIAERAYHIWMEEGQPEGREEEHWFRALQEVEGTGGLSDSVVVSRVAETAEAIDAATAMIESGDSDVSKSPSKKSPSKSASSKAAPKGKSRKS